MKQLKWVVMGLLGIGCCTLSYYAGQNKTKGDEGAKTVNEINSTAEPSFDPAENEPVDVYGPAPDSSDDFDPEEEFTVVKYGPAPDSDDELDQEEIGNDESDSDDEDKDDENRRTSQRRPGRIPVSKYGPAPDRRRDYIRRD